MGKITSNSNLMQFSDIVRSRCSPGGELPCLPAGRSTRPAYAGLARRIKHIFPVITVLGLFLLAFSPPVLAGFHRNLENGLGSGYPGGYRKAPAYYQVGNTFHASDWINNPTNHDISDNFWLEVWRVEKCERSSGTIDVTSGYPDLTENELDQCSGGTIERVARTQKRWWWQDKHQETVRQGRSLELAGDWKIDQPGYYQFDFFSDSTWSHGPFATGFFRALPAPSPSPSPVASPSPGASPSPSPSPGVSPSPSPSASPVVTPREQPKSGGNVWVLIGLGVVTIISGAGFLYLMEHPVVGSKSKKRSKSK